MARFSGKIHSVKFVDTSEKTIEILYGEDSKKLFSYILPLDYTNQDFLDLLEEISIEEIQDKTRDYHQSIENNKNLIIHQAAKAMFEEWIKNAQADLDKQDKERYEIFESYREKQKEQYNILLEELYKEADVYKEEQLQILQSEIDSQIEERYKEVDTYKNEQIAEGFKDVDEYRENQLSILQTELDAQVEGRFKEADEYKEQQLEILQRELDDQVEGRFKEADVYKEEQLKVLQRELDDQVEGRFREADAYKEEQLKILQSEIKEQAQDMKIDLLSKFKSNTTSVRYTPEKVAKYIIDNFEDEDTVFKTKLEIFNLPEVKNSKDREMKMKVCKAKTVPEIFAAYYDIQHSNS